MRSKGPREYPRETNPPFLPEAPHPIRFASRTTGFLMPRSANPRAVVRPASPPPMTQTGVVVS